MSGFSFHSRATHSSSSMMLLVLRQEASRNFMKYSLSYRRRRKQLKYRTKFTQYGASLHNTMCHLATDNAFRFCFAPDISRPLLELEKQFFNEQYSGKGKII